LLRRPTCDGNINNGAAVSAGLIPRPKIDVFLPPTGMSPTGGATTVDYDGKGMIWASSPDGALRFDPATERFTEYKSVTFKTANGTGTTYGAAGDRNGNGYWAEMTLDIIGIGTALRQFVGNQTLPDQGRDGPPHGGRAQVLRDLQPA
jgi:hypothetical protein